MKHHHSLRRGVAAIFALLFLTIVTALAVTLYSTTTTHMSTAHNLRDGDSARVCADSGMLWISWVLQQQTMPQPLDAQITSTLATSLWSTGQPSGAKSISQVIVDAAKATAILSGDTTPVPVAGQNPIKTQKIVCDGGSFQVTVQQDATDGEILHVTSTGFSGAAQRTVKMDFFVCKGFNYAVWSSLGLALGKNTVIQGDIAIPSKFQSGAQIIWGLSDFIYSKDLNLADPILNGLSTDINTFKGLITKYDGTKKVITLNGNRIPWTTLSPSEQAQFPVHRDPDYIDEYDVFLHNFGVQQSDPTHQVPYSSGILTKDTGLVAAIKNRCGPYDPAHPSSDDPIRVGWTSRLDSSGKPTVYNNYNDAPTYMYQNATLQNSGTYTGQYVYYAPSDYSQTNPFFPTIGDYDGAKNETTGQYVGYAKILGQVQLGCALAGSDYTLSGPVINPYGSPVKENAPMTTVTPATFSDAVKRLIDEQTAERTLVTGTDANITVTIPTGRAYDPTQDLANGQIFNRTVTADDLKLGDYVLKVTNAGSTTLTANQYYTRSQIAVANAGLAANQQATTSDTITYTSGKVTGDSAMASTTAKSYNETASSLTHNYRKEYALYTATDTSLGSYTRPVFRNITFTNVTIPKGLNAVFENCTFKGITTLQRDMTSTTAANCCNVRFKDCTINGPLVGSSDVYATPITTSSGATAGSFMWEFNGNIMFDNQWVEKDPVTHQPLLDSNGNTITTTTIMAPQTYVNIGTTVDPNQSKVVLKGTCVATMFDILAAAMVDGSLVNCTTNTSACWNSTLGYFGPVGVGQGQGPDAYNNPAGGLGYVVVRQNRKRPLPYGVSIPLQVLPSWDTYSE